MHDPLSRLASLRANAPVSCLPNNLNMAMIELMAGQKWIFDSGNIFTIKEFTVDGFFVLDLVDPTGRLLHGDIVVPLGQLKEHIEFMKARLLLEQ